MFQVYSNTYSTIRVLAAKGQTGTISYLNLMSLVRQIIMLKILCQFASERKSVDAEFFFSELAFVLAKFSLLCLNRKQRNFPTFLSSKKLKINNWVILAVQHQITSQMLVLRIIFQKSISHSYCLAPRKKTFILAASFDINAT